MPLHTWLPDAMEGPTPVSALIHAATMVTAGVYLIARMHPLFEQAPAAADVGAIVGCATLLIAATIGLVVTDLKRVIAYSTMSQIGYMVMAVSSAAYTAGLFHLMTHAFFKALLFMAAGSLISAMAGNQDLDDMGGFRKAMPFTFGCFIVGGLALSGFPPFSGFFSKDEILARRRRARRLARRSSRCSASSASFLTAIYTFRMIFRAFCGEPVPEAQELEHGHLYHAPEPTNPATGEVEDTDVGFPGPDHHIAEREASMKVAMGALAVLAIGRRRPPDPGRHQRRSTTSSSRRSPTRSSYDARAVDRPTVVGLLDRHGAGDRGHRARLPPVGAQDRGAGGAPRAARRPCTASSSNKWYFDEAINFLVVRPFAWFGRFGRNTFERIVITGAVHGRHHRGGARAARPRCARCSRATCATTRRCCCSGSRRSASTSWWRGHEQPDHPPDGPAVLAAGARAAGRDRAAQLGAGRRRSSARSCRSPTR